MTENNVFVAVPIYLHFVKLKKANNKIIFSYDPSIYSLEVNITS